MSFAFLGSGAPASPNRRQRRIAAKQRRATASLVFEALEPRVLLSADPLSVSLGGDALHPLAHDVIIQQVTQTQPNADHTTVQMIQVIDRDQSNQILASAPTADVGKITITSAVGDTRLTVDATSFAGRTPPPITFTAGAGNNTLAVTSANATNWDITGANSGAVTGSASISFSGVSNLTGGTNNDDTFTVEAGGGLSGILDGGPGGDDTLAFNHDNATNAVFTATGPQSGSVALDRSVFTYAGLEPISYSGTASTILVSGTGQLTLGDTGTPGQIEAASLNNSMESVTFTAPTAVLSVNLTGGSDSLAISALHLSGAGLSATGGGADSITINPGAVVSTRATTNDTLTAPSTADSGDLSLLAASVTVDTGATLLANANSGFNAGAVSLDAASVGVAGQPATAAVSVHGAEIVGGSVSIDASASAAATVSQTTLATLDLSATATAQVDGASNILATTGSLDIQAADTVSGQVTASAAPLGSLSADAAVALAHVDGNASATVSGTTRLATIDTLTVHSANSTTVNTLADGSAGGANAVGGSVALSDVGTSSTALVDTGVHAFAGNMAVGADSSTTVSTRAVATAGGATANGSQGQGALAGATTPDGHVTVAAAIAGTDLNDTASATMGATSVATTQGLDIAVNVSRAVATSADATGVQDGSAGGSGVGAAVALNAISASSTAVLADATTIAGDVTIAIGQARTPDVFGAIAISGEGATDVGVAGALAVNAVSDSAFGGVAAGADVNLLSGGLSVSVTQVGDAITGAVAFLSGESTVTGVGASVAIAPVHFSAEAGVAAGAQLQVGDATSSTERDARFTVEATRTIDTTADGGTSAGTATAAALALTVAHDDASAELDLGATVTVQGNLSLLAHQASAIHTTALAESTARASVVAFGIVLDDTQATSAAEVQAVDAITLTAEGTTASTTMATAGPRGVVGSAPAAAAMIAAELGFLGNPASVALPAPATSDGTFGVAAAMALGIAIGRVAATVEPAANQATTETAERIALGAHGGTAATTRADASAVASGRDGGGIGAALALQVGQANILAEDDAPVTAVNLALSASGPLGDLPLPAGNYIVQAISGAGAAGVGVAGALAVGGDGIKVQALLNGAATVTGTVSLTANGRSMSDVDATAITAARPLGVGASFALDVTDATVTASIEDGGSVTGMPTLTLAADGGQTGTTTAEGGAVGGTASGADFSLAVVTDEIDARLTTKAVAQAGQTELQATGSSTATTTATGNAGGQTTAIGASLAVGFLVDDVAARVDGALVAAGGVTMTATGTTTQQTTADAGARGAAAGGLGAGLLLGNQVAFLGDPAAVTVPDLATADGSIGVAAALSFGVDDSTSETVVTGRLGTNGTLTMTATGGTAADSAAGAAAVDAGLNGVGIAAAAAIMVATPTIRARIDGAAIAADLSMTADTTTPTGHSITSHAISGVGGNDTGVAGAFALTVAHPVTEAALGGSARFSDLGGSATLSASGASDVAASAAAANLGSGKFGLGASVALDIAADDTHAQLEQGARIVDIQDLSLTATGTVDSAAHASAGSAAGGDAGAVAINVAPQDTRAEIDGGTVLKLGGNLLLEATQSQTSAADATGGASGRGGGFGAAIAVNAPVASTSASLDRGVNVAGDIQVLSGSTASAHALATAGVDGAPTGNSADQDVTRWLGAAGTAGGIAPPAVPSIASATTNGAQQLGLSLPGIDSAAALAVDAAFGSTDAALGGSTVITAAGAITVRAVGDSQADATADASAIAPLGAAGIGFAVDYDAQSIDASVGAGTPVRANSLTVEAMVPRTGAQVATAEARAGANAPAGVAGAIALNLVDNSTTAEILGSAPILAPEFIVVDAIGDTDASVQAGYLATGLVAGSGVSLAANLVVDHTAASVAAGAQLNSLGQIDIDASGHQTLQSLSAGIAAAGLAAVPASLTADALLATTAASIGKGARIDLATPGAAATQRVSVQASDTTDLDATAGSLGVGALAGAGAAAQFSDLVKQTTADIDGTVDSAGDVLVGAIATETALTGADAGTLGSTLSVAGGAAVQLGQLLTHAAIDGDAIVHAVGDVVVTARDTTQMDVKAGGFDASLVAAAGAGIGAIGLIKTTEALVEDHATVDADGQGAGSQAPVGYTVSFAPDNPGPGEIGKPLLPDTLTDIFSILLNNPIHNLLSPVSSIPDDAFSSQDRLATPDLVTVHGLAVSALSHDDLAVETAGLGAAGLASLQLSASGIADQPTTQARVGAAAAINQRGFTPGAAQAVLVAASGDEQAMAIAGTLPIGGLAAVGPATALIDMHPDTQASIGTGAMVKAADGITVQATNATDLLNDATGTVLAGGLASVAGSADAVVLGGDTWAWIDANAVVAAGGSVSVSANDSSNTQNVAGGLSAGESVVFAGGVAGISLVAKDTEAWIGAGAQVSSGAALGEAVIAADANPIDGFTPNFIRGVSVLAQSSELIMDLLGNASGSGDGLAFIGSAAGVVIGNTTAAFIAKGALVQAGLFDAQGAPMPGGPAKGVSVGALDQMHSFDGVAAVVDGDIAVSGAVDAGVIRDQTAAAVDAGATIRATSDIDIVGRSSEIVDSLVGGLGLTSQGIELNISASVYSIGAVVPGDLLDPLSVVGGAADLEGYLDGLLQGVVDKAGNGLVGVLNKYAAAVGGQQAAAGQLAALTPIDPVTAAFTAGSAGKAGTTATIDDATLESSGVVHLTANDAIKPDLDTSFTFSKSTGGGAQGYNLSLDGGFLAGRANATASVTDGSAIQAASDIDVTADASTTQAVNSTFAFNSSTGNASALVDASRLTAGGAIAVDAEMDGSNNYSGLMPGISGLKIRTSYNHEVDTTLASVSDGSILFALQAVNVSAISNNTDNIKADGATFFDAGFLDTISLGVALAWNDLANTTSATIDHSSVVADATDVTATATTHDFALGFGAADGSNNNVALGGSASKNSLNDIVSATIESSQVLAATGVSVEATDDVSLLAISGAAVGRTDFGVGGAGSLNSTNDEVTAEIGASTLTVNAGAIDVLAHGTATMSALAAGFAEAGKVAVGAGLPVDDLGMTIAARVVGGSQLFASGDITIHATGDGTIRTLAGGFAIATGQVGFGAALSIDNDTETVLAGISDSHVTADGGIDVAALSDPDIDALAIGFAYAPTVAAGGSVAINNIDATTRAFVDNIGGGDSILLADGSIGVSAIDAPSLEVLTGGAAASKGQVSVAGSVSDNNVDDAVDVSINGARLTASAGPIIIQGVANPDILAIAVAAAGAQNFAGTGAVALNSIGSTVDVTVGEQQAVLNAPVVSITGADTSTIGAVAGGGSVAKTIVLEGAESTNDISGGITVQLDAAGRINASLAILGASDTAAISVITGAAGGAGTGSIGGAVSVNGITDHTTAEIIGGVIDAHDVELSAEQGGTIKALAAVGAGAGTFVGGGSVTTNNIHDFANTGIADGAQVNTGSGSLTDTATNDGEIDSFAGAVGGAGTAVLAAAVANNNISETDAIPGGAGATVANSTITGGTADIAATDGVTVDTIAISGGGAGTGAFGGSVAKSNGNARAETMVSGNTEALSGALAVTATSDGDIEGVAANGEGAGTAAGGAAVVINTLSNEIAATLSGGTAKAGSVSVAANDTATMMAVAATGAGAGTFAGVFSDTENVVSGNVAASITDAAGVSATGALQVSANESGTAKSLSGSASGAGTAGVSGAHAHSRIGDVPPDNEASDPNDQTAAPASTTASIDAGSVVGAGTVAIDASFTGDIETIALGGSAAGTASFAGSVTDNLIGDEVSAGIFGAATAVTASGAIDIDAGNDATIHSLAGALAGSGTVAGGAAVAVNKLRNTADASVDATQVQSTKNGVSLHAVGGGEIESIAAAGGISGSVAIGAAVSINDLQNDITAEATDAATLTGAQGIALRADDGGAISTLAASLSASAGFAGSGAVATNAIANQVSARVVGSDLHALGGSVTVATTETASILSGSEAFSAAEAGISAGVSVNQIDNVLMATIDASTVRSVHNVTVSSTDTSSINSQSGQIAAGFIAVGGSAAYNEIENIVDATIVDGSNVVAAGDVLVQTGEDATVDTLSAGGSFGYLGIGGSVSVSIIKNGVEAAIQDASVFAAGNVGVIADDLDNMDVWAGQVAAGAVGVGASVAVLTMDSAVVAAIEDASVVAEGHTAPLSTPDIDTTTGGLVSGTASGVAVVSRDQEEASVKALTVAAGAVGLGGTVADVHTGATSDAHIVGTQINHANLPGSGVLVHASQASDVSGYIGTFVGGVVGIGVALQVSTIDNTTRAYIADQVAGREGPQAATAVYADTITVSTATHELVSSNTFGIAAGYVGIGGSVAYTDITSTNEAYVRDALLDAKNGAASITVAALDNVGIDTFAGNIAVGFVGAGAAVGASTIGNTTLATLAGAQLNANGAITVRADSIEAIGETVVGASGGFVGVAGSVLVDAIHTDTEATISPNGAQGSLINQDPSYVGNSGREGTSLQTVNVEASDNASIDTFTGAAAAGVGAVGAAIHVGGITNHVAAEIGSGAAVTAAGNVTVTATTQRDLDDTVFAGTAGGIALSGAFSVLSVGGAFDGQTSSEVNSGHSSNSQGLSYEVNSSVGGKSAGSLFSGNDGNVAKDAQAMLKQQGKPSIGDPLANPTSVSGTFALIDNPGPDAAPVVHAGGNIAVTATDNVTVNVTAGAIAAGVASFGAGVGLVNLTDTVHAAISGRATVSAGRDIDILASDNTAQPGTVGAYTGTGGLAAIGGAIAHLTLNLDVLGAIGGDVTVQRATAVDVQADQRANVQSTGFNIGIGGVVLGLVEADSTVDGAVTAEVGAGARLGTTDAIGSLAIAADANDTGVTSSTADSGGIIAGDGSVANSTVKPVLSATLSDQTTTKVAGDVAITTGSSGNASAEAMGTSVAVGEIGVSLADAEFTPTGTASIGQNAVLAAGGDVSVQATHITTGDVDSRASASGGGILSGNGAKSTATDTGSATAEIGTGSIIDSIGTTRVWATVVNVAEADANTLSIGFVAVGGQVATATAAGKAVASLGASTHVDAYALQVEAAASDAALTKSVAAAGGVFSGVGAVANSEASPTVIATIDQDADVQVLANVDVIAIGEGSAHGTVQGTDGAAFGSVSVSKATILGKPLVQAVIGGGSTIAAGGGVQVLAESPEDGNISDGRFDAATALFPGQNIIQLGTPTLLQTGDQVVYQAGAGHTPIGGLTDGRTYSVIDITSDGSAIALGQQFAGAQVDAATSTIDFLRPDGFLTGDKVVYNANGGPAVGGLVDGATYYVRVIDPTTIKLATSLGEALGAGQVFNPALIGAGGLVTLAGNGFANGEAVTYRTTGAAVAGLTNGDTYFVIKVNANQFRLAALPGGLALVLGQGAIGGVQTLGDEGVALDGVGITGLQSLAFALTSAGSGTQQFVGAGGAAAALPQTGQLGYTGSATASGNAGFLGDVGSSVNITIDAVTTALVAADAAVHANTDVSVTALATRISDVVADGESGGFIAPGGSYGTTTDTETTTAEIANAASVDAGRDVRLSAAGDVTANGESSSSGGGVAKTGQANTTITVNPTTSVQIGTGASLVAARDVILDAAQLVTGVVTNTASGGGVGDSSHADGIFQIGSPGKTPLSVAVSKDTTIDAGRDVTLSADYAEITPTIDNSATSAGVYAHPTTKVTIGVAAPVLVSLAAGDMVTAIHQVNLLAAYGTVNLSATATTHKGGIGKQDPEAVVKAPLQAKVSVAGGATITTHGLEVDATGGTLKVSANALEGTDPQPGAVTENVSVARDIVFDGNAILLSGPTPYLVVNRFGQMVDHAGVSGVIAGNTITVNAIENTSPGWVHFVTDAGISYTTSFGLPDYSIISGSGGSFTFVDTYASVVLQNWSALNMVVGDVDPVVRTPGAAIEITVDNSAQFSFAVSNVFDPTKISIGNYAAHADADLSVSGDIEDPIGSIALTSVGGDILAQGGDEVVRGASVTLSAGGDIGTTGKLFAVELVDSAQAGFGFNATAGGDIDVSVLARLRDPSAFIFNPQLGSIVAGGNILLDLFSPVRDNTVLGPDYSVTVTTTLPTLGGFTTSTTVDNDWPNDVGNAPPLPPGIFAFGSTPYGGTYGITLLQAGGNIDVIDPGAATVGLTANVALGAGGNISAAFSGDIVLTASSGDLRVGSIVSTTGAVTLTALDGRILHTSTGTAAPQVVGTTIALTASGGIASAASPLLVHTRARNGLTVSSPRPAYVEEAGLDWSLGDGGTAGGRVRWAALV